MGLPIATDAEAIKWCIKKGNLSKLVKNMVDDGWTQRLPLDIVGNPMPGFGKIKESDNHHQGLGLAKLISLIEAYKGKLWLVTGNTILAMEPERSVFKHLKLPWNGVGIACRFDSYLVKQSQKTEEIDEVTSTLIQLLGDDDGNNTT